MRQGKRGWRHHAWGILAILGVWAVPGLAFADTTLTANTTWTSNQTITGTLTLNSSVVLTVENGADITADNIVMDSSSRIIVQSAGTVITANNMASVGSSAQINANGRTVIQLRGGSWNFNGSSCYVNGNMDISVTNLYVSTSCYLDASERGEAQASGPGAGLNSAQGGSGAGHGDIGRYGHSNNTQGNFYGNPLGPVTAGSGGGRGRSGSAAGGTGGGVVRIQASNSLRLDGYVYANGGHGAYSSGYGGGGASGGSVWITTNKLQGAGRIYAYGGNGYNTTYGGGAGAGGLVYVDYANDTPDTGVTAWRPSYSSVRGGSGWSGYGYTGSMAFYDRINNDLHIVDGFRWPGNQNSFSYRDISVERSIIHTYYYARVNDGRSSGTYSVTASRNLSMDSSSYWNLTAGTTQITTANLSMASSAQIKGSKNLHLTVSGAATQVSGLIESTTQMRLSGAGSWTLSSSATWRSNDLFLDNIGSVTLGNGYMYGNIRGRVANLSLTSTSSQLNANYYGAAPEAGTAAGRRGSLGGSGGGGGGTGGQGRNNAYNAAYYGSAYMPVTAGSGGGDGYSGNANGGRGGGTINLEVTGTLDNRGYFYANGENGAYYAGYGGGGGGGGSILVKTDTLSGTGYFYANGGAGYNTTYDGGGGGGGRIAVYYNSSTLSAPQSSTVTGGWGEQYGGNGTLVFVDRGASETLTTDDTLYVYQNWRWQGNDGDHEHAGFVAYNSTAVEGPDSADQVFSFSGQVQMKASAIWTCNQFSVTASMDQLVLENSARIQCTGKNLTLAVDTSITGGSSSQLNAEVLTVSGEEMDATFTSSLIYGDTIHWTGRDLTLVNGSTQFNVNGRGYAATTGPKKGANSAQGGAGGGHGGNGGAGHSNTGRGTYEGSALQPITKGSGGGHGRTNAALGGAGGGVIRVQLSGDLVNQGYFYANGDNGQYYSGYGGGGGAAGSIWIETVGLSGTGRFIANGGAGYNTTYGGGGGGGGRIAVYYDTGGMTYPYYSTVSGGSGYNSGTLGTLAFIHRAQTHGDETDDTIYAYQGWRWQGNDGPFTYKSFVAYNSTIIEGPDAASLGLAFSDTYELKPSVQWLPSLHPTVLTTENLTMGGSSQIDSRTNRSQRSNGPALTLVVAGDFDMASSSWINSKAVTVTGTSEAHMQSGSFVTSDNVQWSGHDLLMDSSARLDVSYRGYAPETGTGAGRRGSLGGSGAAHGGNGGQGRNNAYNAAYYGRATQPVTAGSGGGDGYSGNAAGGYGGGIIRVQLTGTMGLNGYMLANGEGGQYYAGYGGGGGAGGSIWITSETLAGAGYLQSNGGRGYNTTYDGGGGSGGRIFVDYALTSNFTDRRRSSVYGEWGEQYGDTGTMAFFDRTANDLYIVEGWRWQQNDSPFNFRNVHVIGSNTDASAWVRDDTNEHSVTVAGTLTLESSTTWNLSETTNIDANNLVLNSATIIGGEVLNLRVGTETNMTGSARVEADQVHWTGNGDLNMVSSAVIRSEDIFLDDIGAVDLNNSAWLNGNVRGTVDHLNLRTSSTRIDARYYGESPLVGPGRGANGSLGGSGASHCGRAGVGRNNGTVRATYDQAYTPKLKGSGGGGGYSGNAAGGRGGGVVNLTIEGTFTNNGYVYADGENGQYNNGYGGGGGAGGSIWMRTNVLNGSGRFQNNGGAGYNTTYDGGGGGGGCTAIYYNSGGMTYPYYSTVSGGWGEAYGTVGTLVFINRGANPNVTTDDSLFAYHGWRWQDNDGAHVHANFTAYNSTIIEGPDAADHTLSFSGTFQLQPSAQWQPTLYNTTISTTNFQMDSSSSIRATNRKLTMNVTGTGTLENSAYIDVDQMVMNGTSSVTLKSSSRVRSGNIQWTGRNLNLSTTASYFDASYLGSAPETGTGAGRRGSLGGSGGGHGGRGGQGRNNAYNAAYHGSSIMPVTAGSGGGDGYSGNAEGGYGGGIIRVQLSGELNLVGYMQSLGQNGQYYAGYGGGGGAGGSIWVTTNVIKNAGYFNVNGGAGYNTTYDGGGGAAGRVFVDYVDAVNIAPQNSRANGGWGQEYGETGTIAFYERDVQDLRIVEGWRWQQNDAPFNYRNLTITDSTTDSSAWVRDDGTSVRVDVNGTLSMDSSSLWQVTAPLTDIRAARIDMVTAQIKGNEAVSITLTSRADLKSSSLIESPDLRLAGAGDWYIVSSARMVSNAMQWLNSGSVDITTGYLYGNIRGTMANLYLRNSSSQLNANTYGYAAETGPGAGYRGSLGGSGGAHGGSGGKGRNNASIRAHYDNVLAPSMAGSGGGNGYSGNASGGRGGGVIDLTIAGEFQWNGYIYAQGENGQYNAGYGGGGGAGGTVHIRCNKLRKQTYGYAYVQGGAGYNTTYDGGGGAAGRIMIAYNDSLEMTSPQTLYVDGGWGEEYGGRGTAAYYDIDDDHLYIYNGWRWETATQPYNFADLDIYNSSVVTADGTSIEVAVTGACTLGSSVNWTQTNADLRLDCDSLTMNTSSRIDADSRTFVMTAFDTVLMQSGSFIRGRNFSLIGNAHLDMRGSATIYGNQLLTGRRLTMQTTSTQLNASYYGYAQQDGPGAGRRGSLGGSGGAHGGYGGYGRNNAYNAGIYGSDDAPVTGGSGGGDGYSGNARGGRGGGTIHLNFLEEIALNGYIYADGEGGQYYAGYGGGGGAGGSLWMETNSLTGSGRIYARGGAGYNTTYDGGGGGGGRVAACAYLYGSYGGIIDINGGWGEQYGGPGVFTTPANCDPILPDAAVVTTAGPLTPPSGVFAPGTTDVPVFQVRLREVTNRNAVTIRSLTFHADGSGDDAAHISQVRLYTDADNNGRLDDGDTLLGSGNWAANNGTVTFSGLNLQLAAQGSVDLLLVYDFGETIPNNVTFRARVADYTSADIVVTGTTDAVPLYGAPSWGRSHRVYITPPPIVTYLSPRTVSRGVESYVTLHGYYFNEASRVVLSDPQQTELRIVSIYYSNRRMGVRVPADVPVGLWDVRVTTPYGSNTTSTYKLLVQESCNTGLLGICAAGTDQGMGCEPHVQPGTRSEVCGNGVDEDCNGSDLDCNLVDRDGDGFTPADGDCDDTNSDVFPRDGLGCSAGRDDIGIDGDVRAVVTYSPLDDGGDDAWTQNLESSWYQQAADTLVDSSLYLTQAGDYAEITDSLFLQPFGDRISIGTWVNIDDLPTDGTYTVFTRGSFGAETYGIFYDAVHQCWVVVLSTATGRYTLRVTGYPIARRSWTHVAFSYDGSQLRFYHNGVVRGSLAVTGAISYGGTTNVRVGGGHGSYRTWLGRIDEICLFGRVVDASQWSAMILANRNHVRYAWGNNGPAVRFSYDFGPHEHNQLIAGTFRGVARISGRSSLRRFPTFCSIVGTSNGFEIWDEPSGKLWARYWLNSRIPGGTAINWSSVDYTAAAGGRIYLGSNTNGIIVFDYVNDRVEHWTTDGVSVYGGGVGAANGGRGYGTIDGNGLRLRTNKIRRLGAFARQVNGVTVPHVGVSCDEGVWVVRGGYGGNGVPSAYVSSAYMARDDVYTSGARNQFSLFSGGGGWAVGDRMYYILRYQDNRAYDIVTSGLFYEPSFTDPSDGQNYTIDANSAASIVNRMCAPYRSPTTYGGAVNPIWQDVITAQVNWGSVRDIVIFPNASRNPNADGDDHMIALATLDGVVLLDQADSNGDTNPSYTILKSGEGVDTATEKYVLGGDVNDCTALGRRGNELFVGTNGAGVSRLNFDSDAGSFGFVESYTANSAVALPSNNVTAVSCGKNALVATDSGVASIRFPEPGPCDTGLEGVCSSGLQYLVNNQVSCVPVVFASGETCDNLDNDCDGVVDEHPVEGSICDVQTPIFETIENLTVNSQDCAGGVVALPQPVVHDNTDPNPVVVNDAPDVFPFGTTTVTWQATDKDGNVSTTTNQVTVSFDGQPELEAPANVSAEAVSPTGTVVALGSPTASICIDGGVTVTSDAPARFPVGTTTVTWTAQGVQGRSVTATQVVTITDTTNPTIEVGNDLTFNNAPDVVLPTPVVSDNATLVGNLVITNNAPNEWPVQQWTTVTFTVTDEAGNSATDSMRIYVQNATYPDPELVINAPEEGGWLVPPSLVLARVTDSSCTNTPTVTVNSEDLGVTVVARDGGWDISTNRVSDGIHQLTVTVTSGCSGKSISASRNFGVDSGGLNVTLIQTLDQGDVDINTPGTWLPVSSQSELNLGMRATDNLSGLANLRVDLIAQSDGSSVKLHEQAITNRTTGVPAQGLPQVIAQACTHMTLCSNGRLQMSQLEERFYTIRVTVTDVAGNEQAFNYHIQSLGLREAIIAWRDAVDLTNHDNPQVVAILTLISQKLSGSVVAYDFTFYGGIWLALEDSISLLRQARTLDNELQYDSFIDLIISLSIEFQTARVDLAQAEHGDDEFFQRAEFEITTAQGHYDGQAYQDAFTSLSNVYFWENLGIDEYAVTGFGQNASQGYEDASAVMGRLLMSMQSYIDASENLPGRTELQVVIGLLTPVRVYLQAVVDEGDLAQTDFEHMVAIMTLGDVAQRLQTSENAGVWVRNWRWGLTQIVALYAERALYNASTWITRENGVWQAGQARFIQAEDYRMSYRPDSYMTTLIASRCDIIGVYNAIYEPNYEVPLECCARVREFYDLDSAFRGRPSEIPIPDACLETITVEITNSGFSPSEIRLSVGQKVKFINKTSMAQTLVGGEPGTPDTDALNTGAIDPNGVYETQFGAAAEFGFFSSTQPDDINGGMIIVGDN